MSTAAAPNPPTTNAPPASNTSRGGRRRYRSRRGGNLEPPGGHNASAGPVVPAPDLRPASVAPGPTTNGPSSSSGRDRRGIRGGRRGGQAREGRGGTVMGVGGRAFGGLLTTATPIDQNTGLHADAPIFTPGQPVVTRQLHNHPPRPRRMSKSTAPDIGSRTHEDISNGLYECPICTSEILRYHKIWSCKTCWTVFHMTCIKKWSKNEGSTQQQRQTDGEMPPARQWRCPGCNLPKDELPTNYTCWCAKEIDPKPIPGLPPHSCGQTCSKPRAPRKCPHPCELICHAGPCPPCAHIGPTMACFCGKDAVAKRCIETDYDNGWSCAKKCGDIMPCGEHECDQPCHEGLCGSCEVLVEARCYCGKLEKMIPCSERGEEKESQTAETWIGRFDCGQNCERIFDCGKHSCTKGCHQQTGASPHCPFSPDIVSHCPCGKTHLAPGSRISCEQEIPRCARPCEKPMRCGHLCQEKCHSGDCMPCLQKVSIKCRCGRTTSATVCHQGLEELPQCMRTCKALLNCGRHECGERCCPAEAMAGERQARKRKARTTAPRNDEDIEAEHICTRNCGRSLKCGDPDHVCQELCHRGQCGSCREAIFHEIACHCGRTVLQPPLPCGTQPPSCHFQCDRTKSCGHPQVKHECHMNESCPKCPYLVEKPCMCGKQALKNQPCWSQNISCGQLCGRRLKCGIHFCQRHCHRGGECEDVGKVCPQQCGQTKTAPGCGHPCLEACHAPYPCKEDKPCQAKVIITCDCQNQKQEVRCMAAKTGEDVQRKTLQCNDECLRLQRNQKLAQALNIHPDHTDDHIPYSTVTLDLFKDLGVKFGQAQEREFRVFAADTDEKRLRFKPMNSNQRAFLHSLAEDFGLDSESMDPEPHRHVAIFKTPRFVSAPMKTLGQCLKIKATSDAKPAASTATIIEPYNGLIVTNPRFALTIEELRSELSYEFGRVSRPIKISFLPSEEIVLYAQPVPLDEPTCQLLKPLVAKTVLGQKLASNVSLCRLDTSLNVTRREEDAIAAAGWSQVVKGAARPKTLDSEAVVGGKGAFMVLGSRLASAKKAKEPVIEDWESAVDSWEG